MFEPTGDEIEHEVPAHAQRLRAVVGLIDLTTLDGSDTEQTVEDLCQRAMQPGKGRLDDPFPPAAAVCVYPRLVPTAVKALRGSGVRAATVAAGFPSAQFRLDVRLADVRAALETGVSEIDMVINRGIALAGRDDELAEEVRAVRSLCCEAGVDVLKVILETGELGSMRMIRHVAEVVLDAAASTPDAPALADGSVFLKTSTGKSHVGATAEGVRTLCEVIGEYFERTGVRIGLKASGGIRTVDDVDELLEVIDAQLGRAWFRPELLRFGASSLLDAIIAALETDG